MISNKRYIYLIISIIECYLIIVNGEQNYDVTMFIHNTKKNQMFNLTCVYSGSNISSSIIWSGLSSDYMLCK